MSETLPADKGKVLQAYAQVKGKRKLLLESIFGAKALQPEIKERITNFNDVLQENGKTEEEFRESCQGLEPDEVAYKMIKEIVKAFNEGWTPDWTNGSEYKYYPWFKMGSPSGGGFSYGDYVNWASHSLVGSRLCFKSSELAKYAGTQFEDIYKEFLTLNK